MIIEYRTKKLEKICTNELEAKAVYNEVMAKKIKRCIVAIRAADSIELLLKDRIYQCHKLTGNRKHQYAMHLQEPYRLIFEKADKFKINIALINSIEDYH